MRCHVRSCRRAFAVALSTLVVAGCGDDPAPTGIDVELVAGTYLLTTLTFDPQGTLPASDIRSALGVNQVQLILTANRTLQVVYRDPISSLFVTIGGTFRTTDDGARLEFASNSQYRDLLFSRRMEFSHDATAGTLTFDAEAPDGVSRARLVALVPALQGEQLLDPTPGRLRVVFQGS